MRLASLKHGCHGQIVVVSRDLTRAGLARLFGVIDQRMVRQ